MRIPRLLEVLGRVGRPSGRPDRAADGGHRISVQPYAPAPLDGAARPRVYVEEVKVRTGRIDALEAGPPGFQVGGTKDRPAAQQGVRAEGISRPQRRPGAGERERISVANEIEGGGQPLRRPPAQRR
ncbi:MAG: hypothetical protein RIB84_20745 [Sneathiellaceae bacterium]